MAHLNKQLLILLIFDNRNRLLVRENKEGMLEPTFVEETDDNSCFDGDFSGKENGLADNAHFLTRAVESNVAATIYCAYQSNTNVENGHYYSLDEIQGGAVEKKFKLSPALEATIKTIEPHLAQIPYLEMGENEYIYRFRTLKERNADVYIDENSQELYQSKLCNAIKAARRIKEKKSSDPAVLDFGVVSYVIPSHFGFCLGVQNAIERAYETVAENPNKRVFMLSELIHNAFVNADLLTRGIRYLQTEKGPLTAGRFQA